MLCLIAEDLKEIIKLNNDLEEEKLVNQKALT